MRYLIFLAILSSVVSQNLDVFQPRRFGGSTYLHSIGYSGLASSRDGLINTKNPASWVNQKQTIIEFDLSSFARSFNSSGSSTSYHSANFEGLNWVSTIKDSTFSLGFTLKPFQDQHVSILNKLSDYQLDPDHTFNADQYITLGGSLNEFSFGGAYRLSNKLYLGMSVDYYSGSIFKEVKLEQSNSSFINYNIKTSTTIYGLNFSLSSIYHLSEDFSLAAFYSPNNSVKTSLKQIISIRNEEFIEDKEKTDPFKLPQRFSIGLNWKTENSGNIYFDYDFESWEKSVNNLNKFSIGYQSSASNNVFDSFFERTNFMLGAYYYNDLYSSENGEQINVYGFTAGTAIPFAYNRNHLFLSVGYSKRGSVTKNNFDESVFTINIGFSVGDFWYQPEIED